MIQNRLLIYSFIILLFVGCKQENKTTIKKQFSTSITLLENEFLIKGITFDEKVEKVYLHQKNPDSLIAIDEASVINNQFTFRATLKHPSYFVVKTDLDNKGEFKFLADASVIELFIADNLGSSSTHSNSDIQKLYKEYSSKMDEFKNRGIDLYYNLKGDFSTAKIDNLKKERAKLFKDQSDYIVKFIKNNPDSYFSAMLLDDNLTSFPASIRQSLFNSLSTEFQENDLGKSIQSNITELENALLVNKPKPEKTISKVTKVKPSTTEYRPNAYAFSGLNPEGNLMSLASIPKGKVVLLDFWASWCGPCRAYNPNLVKLYDKYKDKGLVIMSISEDKGEGEWISAIYEDNLYWNYHILDKNKAIAFRYGVESIPFKVLLDKQGRIASEKISGYALENRIKQLLAE